MTSVRKCKQCGEVKSLTQYREYYGNLKGHYKFCKECERLNQRLKYLRNKPNLSPDETEELNQIEQLHDLQRSLGLEPPRRRKGDSAVTSIIQKQMEAAKAKQKFEVEMTDETPAELLKWLNEELSAFHPDELESIADRLWETYRPIIGVDEETGDQKFDDRHKDVLSKVQERFDAYEEEFYQ